MIQKKIYVVSYENWIRISLHFYNTEQDIDRLIDFIEKVIK
jgi:selenocysteine lyase/cysteine desulfurase